MLAWAATGPVGFNRSLMVSAPNTSISALRNLGSSSVKVASWAGAVSCSATVPCRRSPSERLMVLGQAHDLAGGHLLTGLVVRREQHRLEHHGPGGEPEPGHAQEDDDHLLALALLLLLSLR